METSTVRAIRAAAALGFVTLVAGATIGSRADRSAEKVPTKDTMERVIVLLDGYVQTRFEKDPDRFGLMRLPPPVHGHDNIVYKLTPADPREKEIISAVDTSRFEYLVEFVHCPHVQGGSVGTPGRTPASVATKGITLIAAKSAATPFLPYSFTKDREEFRKTTEDSLYKAAEALLPRLQRGDSCDTKVGEWRVALRPIRASKASCVNCHKGANAGDTLGVMLYAVRPPAKAASNDGAVAKAPGS